MTLWRPPRSMSERTARAVRSMQSGSIDGRIVSARPVSNTHGGLEGEEYDDEEIEYELPYPPEGGGVINGLIPWTDRFTGGGTVLTLTHNPYEHHGVKKVSNKRKVSLHVYWNGVFQEDSTYKLVYSEVTEQTFVILKSTDKHKSKDIITCKYWYVEPSSSPADGVPEGSKFQIGTYVKGTGRMGPMPVFHGGWTHEPIVGQPRDIGSINTMQYGCLARSMPNVTMGFKTLGTTKIPINLHPDYEYTWFFSGTPNATLKVAGGRDATNHRIPCQYPNNCRQCCGFGFDEDPPCRPWVCLGPGNPGGSWADDGDALPVAGGNRIVVKGFSGKTLAKQANNNEGIAVFDPASWATSDACSCTMFGTCVDGSIWAPSGIAKYGMEFWLGATLIITKGGINLDDLMIGDVV